MLNIFYHYLIFLENIIRYRKSQFFMDKKRFGTAAERELIHMFWKEDIPAIRVAGSGSMRYPSPDIVAGTPLKKYAIECKAVKGEKLYIPKLEIEQLREYGLKFGAQTFIGVKFGKDWYFLILDDLRETEASFSINTEEVRIKGLLFEDLVKY
jgi:Holliday junction resolvase